MYIHSGYIHVYINIHIQILMYIHTHTYIYTHTHIYIHAYISFLFNPAPFLLNSFFFSLELKKKSKSASTADGTIRAKEATADSLVMMIMVRMFAMIKS
jgi:hypothetical protein